MEGEPLLPRSLASGTHSSANAGADLVHPVYHFQYGGKKLPKFKEWDKYVFLDSPRLAHPPLDAVLAIDFVISNYFPGKWRDLRDDGAYTNLIRNAQDRCWRPYSYAVAYQWPPVPPVPAETAWSGEDIWPQLV